MLRVIDGSHWKGDIVNTSIDIDAVYTKATEGNYYVDDACDPIVQWAANRGKKWGVFHFATNLITDAITQADYFVDNCLGYIGKGLLMLDNEHYYWANGTHANNALNVEWCLEWLNHVFARTGVRPLLYLDLDVWEHADWSPVIAANFAIVIAAYVDGTDPIPNWSMDAKRDPTPQQAVGWQFTSTGRLDGYAGNLDCNYFYMDYAGWDAYARVQTPPTPAPNPTPDPTPTPAPEPTPVPPDPQPTPQPVPGPSPAPQPTPVPVPTPTPPHTWSLIDVLKAIFWNWWH